jgi:nicotinamidase-related amidase
MWAPPMLIDAARSLLLVVDMQEKLLPAIHDRASVIANTGWLIRVATRMGVPVAALEQYPQGLGQTEASLRELVPAEAIAAKVHFSGVAARCLPHLPGTDRAQVVIAGVEAHVCVLQTALDLAAGRKSVFVVADCVGSRRVSDRDLALARLRQEGVRIVSREMVAFEWLREAGTPLFREICREFLKHGAHAGDGASAVLRGPRDRAG